MFMLCIQASRAFYVVIIIIKTQGFVQNLKLEIQKFKNIFCRTNLMSRCSLRTNGRMVDCTVACWTAS
jgi:hypothetical protein